jgi:putative ABC transport system permease protein
MLQDLRHALRSLRHSPTFTIVALAVLTLAIGAGTAVFSVVDAVVLRGLPFDEHDRLAAVLEHDTKRATTFGSGSTTTQMFLDWRTQQQSFEGITAAGTGRFEFRNEAGEPAETRSLRVTHEFFRVMRVAPLLGRAFTQQDEIDGRHRVVILSHGYWQRRFGGSPDVVGRVLDMSDQKWEVVGVMPAWFAYPVASDRPTDMYTPIAFRDVDKVRGGNRNYNFTALGRLKPGVTFAQANDDMNRLMVALDGQHPKWSPGRRARVIPLHEHLVGRVRSWMLMLLGAVVLVLLIACANVANLMLARATIRGREIAIRAALGAGRVRLIRGLLVEGLLLSLGAAALGVAFAWLGVQALRAWMPANVPRVADIGIDLRVLVTAVAAAVLTGLVFGVVPAFQVSRPDLAASLKDAGRSSTAGAGSQRLRSLLVVAEVALAVILLVGAGLFIGSFARLMAVDTGFDYRNVLTLDVGVRPDPKLEGREVFEDMNRRSGPYVDQILAAVGAVPGIASAAAVQGGLPLTGSWSRNSVELPGRGELKGDDDSIDRRSVSARYLETMRIPLRRGRYLNEGDREGSDAVVVINEAAARKYWPGEDPLGKRIRINSKDWTVVGIVGDIRHLGPEIPPRQECYAPAAQAGYYGGATLVMRTTGDPLDALPAVKAAIWSVNREQRLRTETVTLEAYMDRLVAQRRFNMALLALFGVLGLTIAAAGIYGVMAYLVAQRTSEIGVRMALGATRWQVMSMILQRASVLTVAGILIGASLAWWFSGAVRTFLFQVEPADPRIFAAALATLALSGLVASAIPARRAASVDPMIALRQE